MIKVTVFVLVKVLAVPSVGYFQFQICSAVLVILYLLISAKTCS